MNINRELNIKLLSAFIELSKSDIRILDYRLETNFITGEIIWCHGRNEIYVLPYLISDKITININKSGELYTTEMVNVDIQTNKYLIGELSTHDMVVFIINLSTKKILEYTNILEK